MLSGNEWDIDILLTVETPVPGAPKCKSPGTGTVKYYTEYLLHCYSHLYTILGNIYTYYRCTLRAKPINLLSRLFIMFFTL